MFAPHNTPMPSEQATRSAHRPRERVAIRRTVIKLFMRPSCAGEIAAGWNRWSCERGRNHTSGPGNRAIAISRFAACCIPPLRCKPGHEGAGGRTPHRWTEPGPGRRCRYSDGGDATRRSHGESATVPIAGTGPSLQVHVACRIIPARIHPTGRRLPRLWRQLQAGRAAVPATGWHSSLPGMHLCTSDVSR